MEETRYDLPPLVQEPFEVYINGVLQRLSIDYQLVDRTLVFPRSLKPEAKMSRTQWILGTLGIAGSYKKHDTVDITYQHEGKPQVATGLLPRQQTT
jgi:hypothetical protein